mmetsp:Transcript_20371/g.60823  ORF Transcript_20371/g.60823 Transcript_20371/m.60823 type:complete len:246 (+) Transcript_20371:8-745(+)
MAAMCEELESAAPYAISLVARDPLHGQSLFLLAVQALPVGPLARDRLAVLGPLPEAVHLAPEPLPGVLVPVRPALHPVAVLEVGNVLAGVGSAVRVCEGALALHLLLDPLAVERAAVAPDVHALAVDVVVVEPPFEVGAIGPQVVPEAVLAAGEVLADVLGTVHPLLGTLAALAVVHPLAGVPRAVLVQVRPVPVLHVVLPLALVGRAVGVLQPTMAVGLVVYPLPLVDGAVRLDVDPLPVAHVA